MSERSIIAKTKAPNTVETMYRDLVGLGVREGDILMVHSSLSSIGWVCGGPQALIMALRKAVGPGGTVAMPAHSGDWSDPAAWENPPVPKEWLQVIYDGMPAYDPDVTPTRGIGCVAELFRTYPGTLRSSHPQVSFSANGKHAAEIIAGHPLTPQMGMDSPLGKLYRLNAKILLLGVGYDSCTSFHLAEALLPGMPVKRQGTAIRENGERVWKWFDDFAYDSGDFAAAGKYFEKKHTVAKGKIGNAKCTLLHMREGVDATLAWLADHRFNK